MLQIKRLYSEPEIFDPITFTDGFNIILGETTEGNDKTNGVGKSMAVEFINYALLKRNDHSRVSLISEEDLSHDTVICLDFELSGRSITSKRAINDHECPVLIIDGIKTNYSRLSDASNHLSTILFSGVPYDTPPSFRMMMGPLIRDEGSEFKSIISCFDTNKKVPPEYTPHLFLLQVDPSPYKEAKRLQKEMTTISAAKNKMKENITTLTNKNISESKADLNELEHQVCRIQDDIEKLENIEGFDVIKDEIIDIENQLEQDRSHQAVLKSELSKIDLFRGDNYIDGREVADIYNQFKEGLGDIIKRELDEVTAFKQKIDNFQQSMMDDRKASIEQDIRVFEEKISTLSKLYKEKISLLDQDGLLVSLKQTISIHEKKVVELSSLSSFIQKHTDYENEYKEKKRDRQSELYLLDSYLKNSQEVIKSFEKTILDMHDYVFGNRRSSFEIEVTSRKETLKFELRTDSDGSHSINREKVFLYDFSLLLNAETTKNHPCFLIHDNIFDVDKDTLIKSINYIGENLSLLKGKQYILTINSDKFSAADLESLNVNLDDYSRAVFTKENKFLKMQYQELSFRR